MHDAFHGHCESKAQTAIDEMADYSWGWISQTKETGWKQTKRSPG